MILLGKALISFGAGVAIGTYAGQHDDPAVLLAYTAGVLVTAVCFWERIFSRRADGR